MSKVKEELQELRREIGTHDTLIHNIYSNLIQRLNREIGNSALAAKDIDSITELSKKCRFLEIEAKERRRKINNESTEYLKDVMEIVNETGWFLPDAMEVLCEINVHGFSYPESINILKEVLHIVNSDYQLDWRLELAKIVEKRQKYIQEYEKQKNFEKDLHQGLETAKGIRKKEIEQELKDIDWDIHYLENLYKGPHYYDGALDLYKARKQKFALMQELVEIEKEEGGFEMEIKRRQRN